ncbi:hypothetical protein G9A89_003637 [Geosiphon pyriformis]|nr:hypothetical protein G9A89_003637 [Geosiphon pyriformis]
MTKELFVKNHVQQILFILLQQLQQDKITRYTAIEELQTFTIGCSYGEMSILEAIKNIIEKVLKFTLKSSVGKFELCNAYINLVLNSIVTDPDRDIFLHWSNREAPGSKARKLTGRARQPDAIINTIDQLSWDSKEVDNLYNLCANLIRIATFNKDEIDAYNIQYILELHISFYFTTLLYDSLYVMMEISDLNVPMSLQQLLAFLTSLDTLLIISDAYWKNCFKSNTVEMKLNKCSTLATPNFKELIANS